MSRKVHGPGTWLICAVILFDPLKIAAADATVDPKDPRYIEALTVLMALIRKECRINLKTRILVGLTRRIVTASTLTHLADRGLSATSTMWLRKHCNSGRQRSLQEVSHTAHLSYMFQSMLKGL